MAHLRGHAGAGDNDTTASSDHGCAAEHHVEPVADGHRALQRRDVLHHRLALAGQRRFGDRQRCRRHQPPVGADSVAFGEQHDVARDEIHGVDPLLDTVTHHRGRDSDHALEGGHRLLGPSLLHVTEHGVGDEDGGNDEALERETVGPLDGPRDERDDRGGDEQVDEWVGELRQQLAPPRNPGARLDLVGAGSRQSSPGLGRREPAGEVGVDLPCDRRRVCEPGFGAHASISLTAAGERGDTSTSGLARMEYGAFAGQRTAGSGRVKRSKEHLRR